MIMNIVVCVLISVAFVSAGNDSDDFSGVSSSQSCYESVDIIGQNVAGLENLLQKSKLGDSVSIDRILELYGCSDRNPSVAELMCVYIGKIIDAQPVVFFKTYDAKLRKEEPFSFCTCVGEDYIDDPEKRIAFLKRRLIQVSEINSASAELCRESIQEFISNAPLPRPLSFLGKALPSPP